MRPWLLALLLALSACPPPATKTAAPAPTYSGPTITLVSPDAQDLVDAWATAVGGRAAISDAPAIYLSGSIEKGGLRGTVEL